jgi:hypothetical protein
MGKSKATSLAFCTGNSTWVIGRDGFSHGVDWWVSSAELEIVEWNVGADVPVSLFS